MMEWKSIKEQKPPIGEALIVTVYDGCRNRRELRYPVTYRKSYYNNGFGFYQYGVEENYLMPEYSEVLAWMRIPSTYEGEIDDE